MSRPSAVLTDTASSKTPTCTNSRFCRARALGFSIEDCRTLLALYEDDTRASADVKAIAREHLARINDKIAQLQSMADTLGHLVACCAGDTRPDCPILNDLARH